MSITPVIYQLISLFLILILGYYFRKKEVLDEKSTKGMSALLTMAGLPAVVLVSLQEPFSKQLLTELLQIFGATFLLSILGVLFCMGLTKSLHIPYKARGAWFCTIICSNIAFMGRPLLLSMYGESIAFHVTASIFSINVIMFSLGIIFISRGAERGGSTLQYMATAFHNPTLICSLLGFVFFVFGITLPTPVNTALNMIAGITAPVSMLVIGSLLTTCKVKELFLDGKLYLLSFLKLLIVPLCGFAILKGFSPNPMVLGVIVLTSAMPTAASVAVISEQYENEPLFCSKVIFISTLLCGVTIPIIASLLVAL